MRNLVSDLSHQLSRTAIRLGQQADMTPLKRKNQRRKLLALASRLRKAIDAEFPPLDGNGRERKGKTFTTCPLCRIPISVAALGKHFVFRHHSIAKTKAIHYREWECVCGDVFRSQSSLGRHLAMQSDPIAHVTLATLGKVGAV